MKTKQIRKESELKEILGDTLESCIMEETSVKFLTLKGVDGRRVTLNYTGYSLGVSIEVLPEIKEVYEASYENDDDSTVTKMFDCIEDAKSFVENKNKGSVKTIGEIQE